MTDSRHDEFGLAAAAYATDALDAVERREFEAHLATCVQCQADVAAYRRVTAGLGLAVEPVAPPASLKARTLARATGKSTPGVQFARRATPEADFRRSVAWLAAAAGVMLAVATGIYAWSLRAQLNTLRELEAEASARVQTLRGDLADMRRDSARLTRSMEVLTAPDVMRVDLAGTPDAPGATGRAFWSPSRGLLLSADRLPALQAGRIYQLWVVLPNKAPISAGLLGVGPNGSGTIVSTVSGDVAVPKATVVTIAITREPAGGSSGPTLPILLAGNTKTN